MKIVEFCFDTTDLILSKHPILTGKVSVEKRVHVTETDENGSKTLLGTDVFLTIIEAITELKEDVTLPTQFSENTHFHKVYKNGWIVSYFEAV